MFVLCLLGAIQAARPVQPKPTMPSQMVARLETAMREETAWRCSMYVIEPTTLFRAAMTPDRIRDHCDVSLDWGDVRSSSGRLKSFQTALKHTTFSGDWARPADVRYGFAVRDTHGKEIFLDVHDRRWIVCGCGRAFVQGARCAWRVV